MTVAIVAPRRGRKILVLGTFIAATLSLFTSAVCPAFASTKPETWIVIDSAGKIVTENNADALNYPASLTKMMTLYLTFEALERGRLSLSQSFTVSAHAAGMAPSKLGVERGESVPVRDLILGMVTKSANDAAVVMAEGLGGTEAAFAERMTLRAHQLGMSQTVFRNASGLPNPLQHTTARDLAKLALALYRDYPNEYKYFSTETFTYRGEIYTNHNHLMEAFEGMDGIKTGFINAAGFNLAASAVRDRRRLIGVIMGGRSAEKRDDDMATLLDDAFRGHSAAPTTMVASAAPAPTPAAPAAPAASAHPQMMAAASSEGSMDNESAVSSHHESLGRRALHALSPIGRAEAATRSSHVVRVSASRSSHGRHSAHLIRVASVSRSDRHHGKHAGGRYGIGLASAHGRSNLASHAAAADVLLAKLPAHESKRAHNSRRGHVILASAKSRDHGRKEVASRSQSHNSSRGEAKTACHSKKHQACSGGSGKVRVASASHHRA